MTVLITLTTAGTDTGPFNLYSNSDGFVSAFETGVTKASLLSGYPSSVVPDDATIVRIVSDSVYCTNSIDISILCERPSGLENKLFYSTYTPLDNDPQNFTDSFSTACIALNNYNTVAFGNMSGTTDQLSSFIVGATVYKGLMTNCDIELDGYYITDLVTGEITNIVGGVINSITYCTTTTTTTSPPTTTTTTTL